jgi:hypothetical protein
VFFSLTTKPAEMLSFYPGADNVGATIANSPRRLLKGGHVSFC